jgi:predicted metalloprotease with PDZ domain
MNSKISRVVLVLLLSAAAALGGDDVRKCNATARECEQEIRQMLAGLPYLGAYMSDLNPGIGVKSVSDEGPASHADLREGDRIIAVNGRSMIYASAREFKKAMAEVKDTGVLHLIIQRRSALRKVEIRLEPFPKAQIDKIVAAHLAKSHSGPGAAGSQP